MDCERLRASLYAFLDGELDVKDTIEAEQHVTECPMCEALVRYEERFRRTVRGMLVRERAPAALRERIAAGLDASQRSRFKWMSRLPLSSLRMAAVAAVAAVVVLAVISFLPYGNPPPAAEARAIMDDAVSAHLKYVDDRLPIEFRCRNASEFVGWRRHVFSTDVREVPINSFRSSSWMPTVSSGRNAGYSVSAAENTSRPPPEG